MNLVKVFYIYFLLGITASVLYFFGSLVLLILNNTQLNEGHIILASASFILYILAIIYYKGRFKLFEPNGTFLCIILMITLLFVIGIFYLIFSKFELFLFIFIMIGFFSNLINMIVLSRKPFEYENLV